MGPASSHLGAMPCPPWPIHDHTDQDPDDQLHKGRTQLLAAVTLERSQGEMPNNVIRQPVTTELTIIHYRYPDDPDEWIYIGDGIHGLNLNIESARQLAGIVEKVVEGWGMRSGRGRRVPDLVRIMKYHEPRPSVLRMTEGLGFVLV